MINENEKESIDVSDDNIFLQLLCEKHNISPKQLASWTGRATSTVYKYLAGEIAIPSVIWRIALRADIRYNNPQYYHRHRALHCRTANLRDNPTRRRYAGQTNR